MSLGRAPRATRGSRPRTGPCASARPSCATEPTRSRRRWGGHELVWFPEPIGPRECERVATGVNLLSGAVPDAERITVRLARDRTPVRGQRWLRRRDPEGTWGAIRVEVWGRRGATREPIVYGAIERTAIAAGTVLGVTTAALAGALPGLVTPSAGRLRPRLDRRTAGVPRRALPSRREGRDLRGRARRVTRRSRADEHPLVRVGFASCASVAPTYASSASTVARSSALASRSENIAASRMRASVRSSGSAIGSRRASAAAYSGVVSPGARARPRRAPSESSCSSRVAAHDGTTRSRRRRRRPTRKRTRNTMPATASTSATRGRDPTRAGRSGVRGRRARPCRRRRSTSRRRGVRARSGRSPASRRPGSRPRPTRARPWPAPRRDR